MSDFKRFITTFTIDTYGFDHMTTNLDVNFFLWHQSAWRVLRIAVKINTREECVSNIKFSSMILYCSWLLDQFITVWTKPEKLRMMIYNKLVTIFLELIYIIKRKEYNAHFTRGM